MLVYQGIKSNFIEEVNLGNIANKIRDKYIELLHRRPHEAEYNSWKNSMQYMRGVLDDNEIPNNAGIAIDKEFEDRTVEDWKRTLSVNLIAPFIVSKYVGNEMLKNKSGKIINISSTNGINAFFPTSIDYDASKAGLINLTHNLAIQFAPYINVNCVAPGWVNTDMNKELPKDLIEEETNKIYKKRFAEPSEIAKVVTFLASDDADFINDEIIKVDGGY